MPEAARDLCERPVALALQFHQKISSVGFRDGKPELRASTPGITLDFRRFTKKLFDLEQYAVGLLERRTRGSDVVENECAFVHFGQETAAQARVDANGCNEHYGGRTHHESGVT